MLIPPNGPTRHVQKSRVIDDTTIPQYTGPKDARLTIAKDVCSWVSTDYPLVI